MLIFAIWRRNYGLGNTTAYTGFHFFLNENTFQNSAHKILRERTKVNLVNRTFSNYCSSIATMTLTLTSPAQKRRKTVSSRFTECWRFGPPPPYSKILNPALSCSILQHLLIDRCCTMLTVPCAISFDLFVMNYLTCFCILGVFGTSCYSF